MYFVYYVELKTNNTILVSFEGDFLSSRVILTRLDYIFYRNFYKIVIRSSRNLSSRVHALFVDVLPSLRKYQERQDKRRFAINRENQARGSLALDSQQRVQKRKGRKATWRASRTSVRVPRIVCIPVRKCMLAT